jgi:hypothetical protein
LSSVITELLSFPETGDSVEEHGRVGEPPPRVVITSRWISVSPILAVAAAIPPEPLR